MLSAADIPKWIDFGTLMILAYLLVGVGSAALIYVLGRRRS